MTNNPTPAAAAAAGVSRPARAWPAPLFAVSTILAMAVLRLLVLRGQVTPIGYGVPLIAFLWLRDRRWLWACAAAFAAVSFAEVFLAPPTNQFPALIPLRYRAADFVLVVLDLLAIAGAVHAVIGGRAATERRNIELWAANRDLAAREADIARQNEELASQGEELRAANEELAGREHSLETLLSLSRALASDLTRGHAMSRVCEAMLQLVGGAACGSAILEQDGDAFAVRCCRGFAPADDGTCVGSRIPFSKSFASSVLTSGKTGYLADLSLRPDLIVPQPAGGKPFVSVLAAPLRVGGWPVGTLELYSREKTVWPPAHVAVLESLAAQASVSLEAARLLDGVTAGARRLEAVLGAVPIGVAVANADCSDVRLNPAGAALFEVAPDTNLSGAASDPSRATGPWKLFEGAEPLTPNRYPLRRAARGEEVRSTEIQVRLPGGRRLTLLANASPIRDGQGAAAGAVAAFVDITPLKDLQGELDARRREAEEASVRKTRFLASVSHDIRTPANAISLLAELIRRSATTPELAEEVPTLAEELHGSALSLVNLLSDLLDVARFDSGKIELTETEFPLAVLLADECRQMRPLAREKGLELSCAAPDESLVLRADRIKLSRVLDNLVGNAIKFTEAGSVRVEASRAAAGGLELRVADTGMGIPAEYQRHIFDEFFQLRNPERDRTKGTGLGLTICKRLVDAMGGKLDVRSEAGRGSTFIVTLPAAVVVSPKAGE